jgi:hypothetical protein
MLSGIGRGKERYMDKLEELVYVSIGHASMCWSERPKGVFDGAEARKVAEELLKGIREHEQELLERERMQHSTAEANAAIAHMKGLL